MHLRWFLPPVLNLIFFAFLSPLDRKLLVSSFFAQHVSTLELAVVILAVMFVLLILFTSAELRLTLTAIRFRTGVFSIAFTASFLVSLFFSPSIFWSVHLLLIFSSPWHAMFFNIFKQILRSFSGDFQLVPATWIMNITRTDESYDEGSDSAPPQGDVELGLTHQHEHEHDHAQAEFHM
ncbi:hypothetical protein PTKIN_Ptkin17bG0152900 [Pterospermum kingtungense]